ncbi:MAG: secretin and TonB N-terminal domain-containing protein [Candidatus Eremiobacteraeota bacterium]|nr:secretin and TonB N-terminal domain-containing protein [Candidatus Eremiobacteraeota bacterium]
MQGHYRSIATWLTGGLLATCWLAFAAPIAAATNAVTDVHYGSVDGAFKVTVIASAPVSTQVHKYSVDSASGVQDLVVDVTPASYDGRTKVIAFSDGPIRQVRVGQLSESPAVMRVVVESTGPAKYDLNHSDGDKALTLALNTAQQGHALDPDAAAAAARAAGQRQTQEIAEGASQSQPSQQTPQHTAAAPAPKPQVVAAAKPVVHPAPEVVSAATPNPWLPGGKYYCKVPGTHTRSTSAVAPSMAGPSFPAAPSANAGIASRPAGTVNLDIKNGDLLDVIKLLAQESGQNIVATQNVKGTTTISLHDVPLREALDLIVRTNGLEYRQVGNIYVVGTPDELAKQFGSAGVAAQTVAFPIRYATPADLAKQLSTVLPAGAFSIDPRTDTLLVTGAPEVIQSARNFMALEDIPAPQVVFEVKVLDVTKNNDTQNVGISWTGSSALGLFENCLTCGAFQTQVPPVQSGNPIPFQPFTRNALFIQATINYLLTHNQASLLANPRVEALDNQQAKILVGQTYPIVYYSSQAGQFQVNYIDIGVILQVTPVVNTDGYVTTTLHVERSNIQSIIAGQYPLLDNRKIDSILRVKDGDTIVMGGLVQDDTTKTINKVPLLGDIPVVGALFKNVEATKIHSEIVFLITPHIVPEH